MRLLGILFVAQGTFPRKLELPPFVVLGHELGRCLRGREIALALGSSRLGGRLATARVLDEAGLLGALDLFGNCPRRCAREVAGGELAVNQAPSLGVGGRFEHGFELALAPFRALGFLSRRFDVPQRFRQHADLLVDGFFADSPKRVERVFSGHDTLMVAHGDTEDQFEDVGRAPRSDRGGVTVTLFFLRHTLRCHS